MTANARAILWMLHSIEVGVAGSKSKRKAVSPQARGHQQAATNPLLFDQPLAQLPTGSAELKGGGTPFLQSWIDDNHTGEYESRYPPDKDPRLNVDRGQLTFDAEGQENPGGRYHSRTAHWPGGNSGVTHGRGYDIGQKSSKQRVIGDLRAAGVPEASARTMAEATGKKGQAAKSHLSRNRGRFPDLSLEQQQALFDITYEDEASVVRRISNKPDVLGAYGEFDVDSGNQKVNDLLVDTKFRGDYTGNSRKFLQEPAVHEDMDRLAAIYSDRGRWSRVPSNRFDRRAAYAREAAAERNIERNLPLTFAAPIENLGSPDYDIHGRQKSEVVGP